MNAHVRVRRHRRHMEIEVATMNMFDSTLSMVSARRGALLLLTAALSACMVGPDYRRPAVDVPAAWRLGPTEAAEISNIAWWDQFEDPVLSGLVRTALANNKDLKVATANVAQAAAQLGIVRSAQFPQLDANVLATRQGISQTTVVGGPVATHIFNNYTVNLSASFELDIWG